MKALKRITVVFVLLFTPHALSTELEDEISGFTTDNTITRIGHEFARYLSDYRNSHYPQSPYNLSVYERPSARWGNLIWVEYNHRQVYRRFFSAGLNEIQIAAQQAAESIHKQVNQLELQAMFEDRFDLDKDEL